MPPVHQKTVGERVRLSVEREEKRRVVDVELVELE